MIEPTIDPLEKVIRDSGEGWLIDWYTPPEDALPYLRGLLHRANEEAIKRLGDRAPELTPEALVESYAKNPHKVQAFLQAVGSVNSPHILVLVWEILQGVTVARIDMQYDAKQPFHLHVWISSPGDDEKLEEYVSTDIHDAVILRHLGIMSMGNQGIFDGFYALNLSKHE